ncbi:MAG TPA: hypothetical protein VGM73_01670 [Candidatus Didemnitutus sp.]
MSLSLVLGLTGTALAGLREEPSSRLWAEIARENSQPPVRPTDAVKKMDFQVSAPPENHRFTRDKGGFLAVERVGPIDLKLGVWPGVESFIAHSPPVEATRVDFEFAKLSW